MEIAVNNLLHSIYRKGDYKEVRRFLQLIMNPQYTEVLASSIKGGIIYIHGNTDETFSNEEKYIEFFYYREDPIDIYSLQFFAINNETWIQKNSPFITFNFYEVLEAKFSTIHPIDIVEKFYIFHENPRIDTVNTNFIVDLSDVEDTDTPDEDIWNLLLEHDIRNIVSMVILDIIAETLETTSIEYITEKDESFGYYFNKLIVLPKKTVFSGKDHNHYLVKFEDFPYYIIETKSRIIYLRQRIIIQI